MEQIWEYKDATGITRKGVFQAYSDNGGTDVSYFFKRLGDGLLDVVSGSRLKQAKNITKQHHLERN